MLVVAAADTWAPVTLSTLIPCSWECADPTAEFWLTFSFGEISFPKKAVVQVRLGEAKFCPLGAQFCPLRCWEFCPLFTCIAMFLHPQPSLLPITEENLAFDPTAPHQWSRGWVPLQEHMSMWDKNILLSRLPNLPISPAGGILWPGKRREGEGWLLVLIHHFYWT